MYIDRIWSKRILYVFTYEKKNYSVDIFNVNKKVISEVIQDFQPILFI